MIGLRSVIGSVARFALGSTVARCVVGQLVRRPASRSAAAGEVALLDELERRAAAGAHVVDLGRRGRTGGRPPRCRRRR